MSNLISGFGNIYAQWGERVAFNEGYQAQKISQANSAGRNAFSDGLDRDEARSSYLESKDAQAFTESENVDIEAVGEVMDGEDTLGMESCVAGYSDFDGLDDYDEWQLN